MQSTTRPGLLTTLASWAIGMAEVFEARTASGPTSSSSAFMIEVLMAMSSDTASITRSAPATSPRSLVNVMSARAASCWAAVSLPFLTERSNEVRSLSRVASRYSGSSRTTTGMPAVAAVSAIPAPMKPPPMMATEVNRSVMFRPFRQALARDEYRMTAAFSGEYVQSIYLLTVGRGGERAAAGPRPDRRRRTVRRHRSRRLVAPGPGPDAD